MKTVAVNIIPFLKSIEQNYAIHKSKTKQSSVHKHQAYNVEELVPSVLPLLNKKHIRLVHADTVRHSG